MVPMQAPNEVFFSKGAWYHIFSAYTSLSRYSLLIYSYNNKFGIVLL